jgi:hypothetical protein
MRKPSMWGACLALLAATCAAALHAQQPPPLLFFEGARLIVGDGRSIERAAFVVERGMTSQQSVSAEVLKRLDDAFAARRPAAARTADAEAARQRPLRDAFAKLTDLGMLAAGKSADFMVLDANPLENLKNTQRISEVFLEGRTLDRSGLRATWTTGGTAAH